MGFPVQNSYLSVFFEVVLVIARRLDEHFHFSDSEIEAHGIEVDDDSVQRKLLPPSLERTNIAKATQTRKSLLRG